MAMTISLLATECHLWSLGSSNHQRLARNTRQKTQSSLLFVMATLSKAATRWRPCCALIGALLHLMCLHESRLQVSTPLVC